ncbi:hypothetical protein [Nocardia sp. NPDC003183]
MDTAAGNDAAFLHPRAIGARRSAIRRATAYFLSIGLNSMVDVAAADGSYSPSRPADHR